MVREVVHRIGCLLIRWDRLDGSLGQLILLLQNFWSRPQSLERSLQPPSAEHQVVGKRLMELLPWKWHLVAAILKGDAAGKFLICDSTLEKVQFGCKLSFLVMGTVIKRNIQRILNEVLIPLAD
jgi:hypothetical protein